MPLIRKHKDRPVTLQLGRNLRRTLKRGHPWVFADALRHCPPAPAGSHALLLDNRKRAVARGFYDAQSPLAFRVCTAQPKQQVDDSWAEQQFQRASSLRQRLFSNGETTGYRLFNGEGDGLPGLICDIYNDTAVLQFDGPGPRGFWHPGGIAHWLADNLPLTCVYQRDQGREQKQQGHTLLGEPPQHPIHFLEHGVHFAVDVVSGQKTGFFLDQRENRQQMRGFAAGQRVLNLFGYTGGFSVYAGLGGATHVTTVDLARPAIEAAQKNWELNSLPPQQHVGIVEDAFSFLETARQRGQSWPLIIIDPPSFAPAQDKVKKALAAYQKLVAAGAALTEPDGFLAMASCSSHIELAALLSACEEGISQANRRATIISIRGQPADHPTPLVFSEFRYLQFVLMRVE